MNPSADETSVYFISFHSIVFVTGVSICSQCCDGGNGVLASATIVEKLSCEGSEICSGSGFSCSCGILFSNEVIWKSLPSRIYSWEHSHDGVSRV